MKQCESLVYLKGASFNPNVLTSNIGFFQGVDNNMDNFVSFLRLIEECNRSKQAAQDSVIVYVDDKIESQDRMKAKLESLGLSFRLVIFDDGRQVVNYFATLLNSQKFSTPGQQMKQVVSLLITELNLPGLNGNEVIVQIKELFDRKHNLLRPLMCYLSQAQESVMNQFLTEEEQVEIYF